MEWHDNADAFLLQKHENNQSDSRLDIIMGTLYFYLTGIVSVLSMLGSLVIIYVYVVYPSLRTSGRKMLVWLSVADFLTALGNLTGISWYTWKTQLSDEGSDVLCEVHASLTIFSSISSFMWTVAIAVHLYVCIVLGSSLLAAKLSIPCHILCWILPAIIGSIAVTMDVLGYDQNLTYPSWCWINPLVNNAVLWQYITGKLWEILAYILVIIMYALIKYKLYKQMKKRSTLNTHLSSHVLNDANKKMTFVPLVFISLRIWGTIRFIMGAHFPDSSNSAAWIVPLQGVGDSAQGFANCILFCTMIDKIRNKITRSLCYLCTRKTKNSEEKKDTINYTHSEMLKTKRNQVAHSDSIEEES